MKIYQQYTDEIIVVVDEGLEQANTQEGAKLRAQIRLDALKVRTSRIKIYKKRAEMELPLYESPRISKTASGM